MPHKPRKTRRRVSKPRRPKTYEDICKLQGTEYYLDESTAIVFYTEDIAVDAMICIGDLIAKFYRINEGQPPLAFKLIEDNSQAIKEKVWHVIMRGNFYMDIEQGRNGSEGPHRCRLWFRSFSTKQTHWIATLQLMSFYFNEEQIKAEVIQAVNQHEFYMLPDARDIPIIP